ncbi:proline--tRNA ligase [uncultured Brachyspira sp.]|uniref:proline--tRNA ligase n=1 Tax=uncultured Brachyspira sp. TaxID=221953 RepID=UPI0025EBE14A|nr:proline--tRNA ligase [uncultured Brachyspira sp.]
MRLSKLFMPTLKEAPSDALIASNKLMLRAALARKISNGLYSYLPLGVRVLNKISDIIREEMNAIGSNECIMPILISKELLTPSGRWERFKKELFRLKDRNYSDMAIGPTHEEAFTITAQNEIQSYKDLPLTLYQIHTKFRDEIRPRFGVIRSREFIMKDAYSFHINEESLNKTYNDMSAAYTKIFKRMGLDTVSVKADSGAMGGEGSEEFMVLSEVGEETIIFCSKCGYRANVEKANVKEDEECKSYTDKPLEEISTPNIKTINDLERFFNTSSENFIKSIIYKTEDNEIILTAIRGDLEINEIKLSNALGGLGIELADEDTIKEATGAKIGFASPIGLKKKIRIFADYSIKSVGDAIVGGNKDDTHIKNVNIKRDFNIDVWGDFRTAKEGDKCPQCAETLCQKRGLELGHIFKLGNKYTDAFNFKVLDENNKEKTPIMGCYGIGVNRALASVIEQNYDDKGIIFPISIAPYEAIVIAVDKEGEESFQTAENIYNALNNIKVETMFDDRKERLGVKLNDCDLIGIPMRIIVGRKSLQKGVVEFKLRSSAESIEIKYDEIVEYVKNKKQELFNEINSELL